MFADFSVGETKEGERGDLFTRHDYGIRRRHLHYLAARRSLSHILLCEVYNQHAGKKEIKIRRETIDIFDEHVT